MRGRRAAVEADIGKHAIAGAASFAPSILAIDHHLHDRRSTKPAIPSRARKRSKRAHDRERPGSTSRFEDGSNVVVDSSGRSSAGRARPRTPGESTRRSGCGRRCSCRRRTGERSIGVGEAVWGGGDPTAPFPARRVAAGFTESIGARTLRPTYRRARACLPVATKGGTADRSMGCATTRGVTDRLRPTA